MMQHLKASFSKGISQIFMETTKAALITLQGQTKTAVKGKM
jgi:hypothetical protein